MAPYRAYSQLALTLDRIADANGMEPADVVRHADLLAPHGLDPEDFDPTTVYETETYQRQQVRGIVARHQASYTA